MNENTRTELRKLARLLDVIEDEGGLVVRADVKMNLEKPVYDLRVSGEDIRVDESDEV